MLLLGAGLGVLAARSLALGARHVTCCETGLYSAKTCLEVLQANARDRASFTVLHKRPTELELRSDVPVSCNLLVFDSLLDPSVLGAGLIPAARHAQRSGLLLPGSQSIPMSVTVMVQPIQLLGSTSLVLEGQPLSIPGNAEGLADLHEGMRILGSAQKAWKFSLLDPPGVTLRGCRRGHLSQP